MSKIKILKIKNKILIDFQTKYFKKTAAETKNNI
jgi:hypothetical protein